MFTKSVFFIFVMTRGFFSPFPVRTKCFRAPASCTKMILGRSTTSGFQNDTTANKTNKLIFPLCTI